MAKAKTQVISVADAVSEAFGEFTALGEELRDWYDNMPEGPQGGDKGSAVDEAASTLENISEAELPQCLQEEGANEKYRVTVGLMPKRASRATRCSHAAELLRAVIAYLQDEAEDTVKAQQTEPTGTLAQRYTADELEALGTFTEELEQAADEAEGVEFPGMYG